MAPAIDQPNSAPGIRAIERIIVNSSVYLRCEVLCYDEKLHNSVNRVINQLEELENDINLPDDLLSQIADKHIELLNLRRTLLKTKRIESGFSNVQELIVDPKKLPKKVEKTATQAQVEGQKSAQNIATSSSEQPTPCIYCKKSHTPEMCSIPASQRVAFLKKHQLCPECLKSVESSPTGCEGSCASSSQGDRKCQFTSVEFNSKQQNSSENGANKNRRRLNNRQK